MTTETELRQWPDQKMIDALIQKQYTGINHLLRKLIHERMTMLGIGSLYEYILATTTGKVKSNGALPIIGDLTDPQLLSEVATMAASHPEFVPLLPNEKLQECCETAGYQYKNCEGDDFLSDPARRLHQWALRLLRKHAMET